MSTPSVSTPSSHSEHPTEVEQFVVRTRGLSKRFGDFTALDAVDLDVPRGQVLGLLGPNGAGKSTLIRLLVGATQPTSGTAAVVGLDCWRERDEVHRRVAYLPGDARLPKRMRGREVLSFFAGLRGQRPELALLLAERLELDLGRRVGAMSTGMRQKLALAVAFASRCEVIILDEPTANLDPTVREVVLQLVAEARQAGATVLFSSHVLSEIEQGCDRVVIVKQGRLVLDCEVPDILEQHRITAGYLGAKPEIPSSVEVQVVRDDAGRIELLTRSLDPLLGWLSRQGWHDLRIERVGLQHLYAKWHPSAARLDQPSTLDHAVTHSTPTADASSPLSATEERPS
ncbi:MAG: ABC transporter ATP-binding protein [Planctomycetales bacterium]|nr:ABC transporter ATP-binding protein [Planctomycetales bacterium]